MLSQMKNGRLLQYVDDTALICSAASPEVTHQLLSEDLLRLTRWITQSRMRLDVEKSSVMWFRPQSSNNSLLSDVVIGDSCLKTLMTQGNNYSDDQLHGDIIL